MRSKACHRRQGIYNSAARCLMALALGLSLAACSSSDGGEALPAGTDTGATVSAGSLNQAAYLAGTTTYRFGHKSFPNIVIADAPADADYTRWAQCCMTALTTVFIISPNNS